MYFVLCLVPVLEPLTWSWCYLWSASLLLGGRVFHASPILDPSESRHKRKRLLDQHRLAWTGILPVPYRANRTRGFHKLFSSSFYFNKIQSCWRYVYHSFNRAASQVVQRVIHHLFNVAISMTNMLMRSKVQFLSSWNKNSYAVLSLFRSPKVSSLLFIASKQPLFKNFICSLLSR